MRLTTLGEGVADTRRRVDRAELALHDVPADVIEETLAAVSHPNARLIIAESGEGPAGGGEKDRRAITDKARAAIYEVTHETLIQLWPKPRGWLQDSRSELRLHRQITERAKAWAEAMRRLAARNGDESGDDDHDDPTGRLGGHRDWVMAVAFAPDGRHLVSASRDETLRIWDLIEREQRCILDGHDGPATTVAFSPSELLLASGSTDQTVRLWDPPIDSLVPPLEGHGKQVLGVAFSSDGLRLASGSEDETVRLWDAARGEPICPESPGGERSCALEGHTDPVLAVAFSPDASRLASASADNTVRLWDPETETTHRILRGHRNGVAALAFSPGGAVLVSASDDRTPRLWDPATGQTLQILRGHSGSVQTVACGRYRSLLASAGYGENSVRLWDVRASQLLANGSPPSPRAALLSEVLQRLWWGLRMNGLDVEKEPRACLRPSPISSAATEVRIDTDAATALADTGGVPGGRTLCFAPLIGPPEDGNDKLDQVLAWLRQQESGLQAGEDVPPPD